MSHRTARNVRRALLGLVGAASLSLTSSAMAGAPSGANDWSCRPSAAHPRPVVLVHATFTNMATNWMQISPLLKRNGYCVFAFDYGATNPQLPQVGGLDSVANSGKTMDAFVDRVRAETGSAKVDLVGHSQGGTLLKYYISALGKGANVEHAVAMGPTIHGTTLSGLVNLMSLIPGLEGSIAPGPLDQAVGSDFIKALNKLPDTAGGAKLTVISSAYDAVSTPYTAQRPTGAGTKWIVVQRQCALDFVDHVGLALDSIVHRNILNELDPAHAQAIRCKYIAPVLGG